MSTNFETFSFVLLFLTSFTMPYKLDMVFTMPYKVELVVII